MIQTVVVDDTKSARIALKSDLKTYCPNIKIIGEADSVESAFMMITKLNPDLVFLDIRMADGSGFDLLEKLKLVDKIKCKIIFTTAFDEFAIKAFKYSAIDYLLKPIDPDDLIFAVGKLNLVEKSDINENLQILLESMKGMQNVNKRIALNSIDKVQIVNIYDIIQCESQKNYTLFYLTEKKQVLVTKTLKDFEDMLLNDGFLRVHHSHLINLKHFKEFVKSDGGYAIMSDGSVVPVSVRKKDALFKYFGL